LTADFVHSDLDEGGRDGNFFFDQHAEPRARAPFRRLQYRLRSSGCRSRALPARATHRPAVAIPASPLPDSWLKRINSLRYARRLFERLLTLCNDVGLLSEEYDHRTGRLLGNFPQALSHIALINTAFNLNEATKPAMQRSGSTMNNGKDETAAQAAQAARDRP
jgi:hypothetical protein